MKKSQEQIDAETSQVWQSYEKAKCRYELLQQFVEKSNISSYNQKIIDEMKEVLMEFKTSSESLLFMVQSGRLYVQRANDFDNYPF